MPGAASGTGFVNLAEGFIGTPYQWGGDSPTGFDCSGLVQYSLSLMGIHAPRTSEEQWAWVRHIQRSQLAPGDLVFENWPGEASPGHVAIYAGNNQIIEAPAPGQNVHKVPWTPGDVTASGGTVVGYGRIPGLGIASETLGTVAAAAGGGVINPAAMGGIAGSLVAAYQTVSSARMWKTLGWMLLGTVVAIVSVVLWLRIPGGRARLAT